MSENYQFSAVKKDASAEFFWCDLLVYEISCTPERSGKGRFCWVGREKLQKWLILRAVEGDFCKKKRRSS
ncbi:MAG: hypothetical protein J1F39_04795 [Clostridiales bacterium]|nr:hypothetical protein [Clostridiales bacterium]